VAQDHGHERPARHPRHPPEPPDRPILYVTRADGDWCFLCGSDDPTDPSVYRVAGIGHVLDLDPTVAEVLDLVVDEEADRAVVGGPWTRTPC